MDDVGKYAAALAEQQFRRSGLSHLTLDELVAERDRLRRLLNEDYEE